ncbi:hypothetical protein FISHEDRAFT_14685, partial [Fistulina hepatica ATCC 64428]
HQIIATIAQMYLRSSALPAICIILSLHTTGGQAIVTPCNLAFVAVWADQVRKKIPWSAPLHYIGAVDDHPP